MKLLICGGRDFNNYEMLDEAIKELPLIPFIIIEGGAEGADSLARQWAINNKIHYAEVPALWDQFGKPAGQLRNNIMGMLKPDHCLAMPGGNGTHHMICVCKSLKISVTEAK